MILKLAGASEPGDPASNDDRLMGTRQQVHLPLRSALSRYIQAEAMGGCGSVPAC
jgi:hypothetical protein